MQTKSVTRKSILVWHSVLPFIASLRAFNEMFLQHCDGVDIAFPFGKRDINLRNVNAQCCDTDLCNYPAPTLVPVTGMLQNIMGQQARF